jgi:hypothetical protein
LSSRMPATSTCPNISSLIKTQVLLLVLCPKSGCFKCSTNLSYGSNMWDIAGHARHPGQQTECGCSMWTLHHKLPPNDLNLLPNTAQFDFGQVLSFCVASLFSPDPSNNEHLDFHTSRPSHISLKCMTKTYPLAVYTARQASSFPVTPTCWTLLTSEQIWTPFSQDTTVTSLVRSKGAGKPATETPVTAEEGTNSNGCRGREIPELEIETVP